MKGGRTMATMALLHALLLVYSLSSAMSKFAATATFPSPRFVLCYGGMILLLVVYALGWQQVIKRMPLTSAYANRAVTVIWGMVWGVLVFKEGVSPLQMLGAVVVMAGVVLFALSDRGGEGDASDG